MNNLLKKFFIFCTSFIIFGVHASPVEIECVVKEVIYEGDDASVPGNKITVLFEINYVTDTGAYTLIVDSSFKIVDSKSKTVTADFRTSGYGKGNINHETWDRIDYIYKWREIKTRDYTSWYETFFHLNRVSGEIAFGRASKGRFDGKEERLVGYDHFEIKGVCDKPKTPRLKF